MAGITRLEEGRFRDEASAREAGQRYANKFDEHVALIKCGDTYDYGIHMEDVENIQIIDYLNKID